MEHVKSCNEIYPTLKRVLMTFKCWVSVDNLVIHVMAEYADESKLWNDEWNRLRALTYTSLIDAILNNDPYITSRRIGGNSEFKVI